MTDTTTDAAAANDELVEHLYLSETVRLLDLELRRLTDSIDSSADLIRAHKEHLWENRRDMDFAEKATFRGEVDISVMLGERAVLTRERVQRLLDSPYFGRVDFHVDEGRGEPKFYIGVHNFFDPETHDIRIHDWRAPVSSLYYDFESGRAHVDTPAGRIEGDITSKRQYKIRGGELAYMFDSAVTIGDDVLQRELSESADDKMRNIVATIQREQNAMIRNETAQVLILQGVAGSGKTSIALHRVAFLLYRFKETLNSDNVMILSPNRIFGDYISDVLPELGEERIAETDFAKIAGTFLDGVVEYETFDEQVVALLDTPDSAAAERMHFKSTPEFVTMLDSWVAERTDDFVPGEISRTFHRLDADWVEAAYREVGTLPVFARLERVVNTAVQVLRGQATDSGKKWTASDTAAVRRQVRAMFPHKSALAMYKTFFRSQKLDTMFQLAGRSKIEYADVFPLIYLMVRTDRFDAFDRIEHLLVDEMQDYTAVQYAVLRQLFSCRMTILGDANQTVNPFSSSTLDSIHRIFPEADCMELRKSYRSTTEITEFAQNISRNPDLIPIERHGPLPEVTGSADEDSQIDRIIAVARQSDRSEHRSLGIVCKTVDRAAALHGALSERGLETTLLDYASTAFSGGTIVTSAHIAKGLEFDRVIVPDVDAENYRGEMDKCMLYIACTRAMHELHLTYDGERSPLLDFVDR